MVTSLFLLKKLAILTESVHLFCFLFRYLTEKTITGLALGSLPKLTRLGTSACGPHNFKSHIQVAFKIVRPLGFEPRTVSLKGSCSTN